MPARVFISHSAKEQPSKDVLDELEKALHPQFDVLLDKTTAELGEPFRSGIYEWIDICHAAIAILSASALESEWVRFELSNLVVRRANEEDFRILPVLLPPVTPEDLTERRWEPLDLNEVQGMVGKDPAAIAAAIRKRLEPVRQRHDTDSPLYELETDIAALLRKVDPAVLENAARRLGFDITRWQRAGDTPRTVAQRLLAADLRKLIQATIVIRETEPSIAPRVFELAAPAWVSWEAAQKLRAASTAEAARPRAIALNSSKPITCQMYVRRARHTMKYAEVALEGHENAGADLVSSIRAELIARDYGDERSANAELDDYLVLAPLVVILPLPIDRELVDRVSQAFPHLTLFFMAGAEARSCLQGLGLGDETYLVPELQAAIESRALRDYEFGRGQLRVQASQSGAGDVLREAV